MLYHLKPRVLIGETIYPLNALRHFLPAVYEKELSKYKYRKHVPNSKIDMLGCTWADVVFLTSIHPHQLSQVLQTVGFKQEIKFEAFEIDWKKLDRQNLAVYDFDTEDSKREGIYSTFDAERFGDYSQLRGETTLAHYRKMFGMEKMPFLFAGVTHILHRGELSIKGLPVVTG